MAALAAVSAAICAAKGVLFLEPLKPSPPALAHESAFPAVSVNVTMVLLKVERICAAPRSIFFFSRRLLVLRTCFLAIHYPPYFFFRMPMTLFGPLRVLAF